MKALKILLPVLAILSSGCSMQNFIASVPVMPSIPHYTFSLSFNPKVYLRPDTNTVLVINKANLSKQHLSARNLRSVKAGRTQPSNMPASNWQAYPMCILSACRTL